MRENYLYILFLSNDLHNSCQFKSLAYRYPLFRIIIFVGFVGVFEIFRNRRHTKTARSSRAEIVQHDRIRCDGI